MMHLLSGAVFCSSSIPESSFPGKNGRDFLVVFSLIPEQNSPIPSPHPGFGEKRDFLCSWYSSDVESLSPIANSDFDAEKLLKI